MEIFLWLLIFHIMTILGKTHWVVCTEFWWELQSLAVGLWSGLKLRSNEQDWGCTAALPPNGSTNSYRHLQCWMFERLKNTGKTKFSVKTSSLPYPCCPYANDGGIVTFRFSPGHIFIIAISKPFMTCPTPRTNHFGWPSFCVRLLKKIVYQQH